MQNFARYMLGVTAGGPAVWALVTLFGQALTGGLRTTTEPGPVEPLNAVFMVLWFASVAALSAWNVISAWRKEHL